MTDAPRIFEVRLIVIVLVNVTNPEFSDALRKRATPSSVAGVVSSEIVSNLESVPYIESVVTSEL